MGFETQDVERKVLAILNALGDSQEAVGSTIIAKRLKGMGIELSERAVRYHLRLMDERGFTRLVGRRDGRIITELGQNELKKAMVTHKVGFALSRIEVLSFRTDVDLDKRTGSIPANVSFFNKEDFNKAMKIMKPIFQAGFCVSDLVAVASEGQSIGDLVIPTGKMALATVCSIVVNGTLLKAGVPIDSKFGGILQIRNRNPLRFIEIIHYAGSSLDPTEIFIRANMTSVIETAKDGNGEILANYREIPAICRPLAEEVVAKLKDAGIGGILLMGNVSEPVCEVPIEINQVGVILIGGLNPVAAAVEAGIISESHAMSTIVDYQNLVKVTEV
ncbi:MAG: NrpR regulatory domain-containing protein [Candidatus Omnitrophica bacterium]|nr:NrpR regulatory domain-containing protein [Candidatus Omnitrophota bacterium]